MIAGPLFPEPKKMKLSDMHKKVVQIIVVHPNIEVNEPYGYVYAVDDERNMYVLAEWRFDEEAP